MAKTVFILGAGASANAGAPVMANFLDCAREEWLAEQRELPHGKYAGAFAAVFDGISRLQIVHSKATLDFKNIENIFAAFEMANLFGRLGDLKGADVERLVSSLRGLIVRTLERRMLFDELTVGPPSSSLVLRAPHIYDLFGRLIATLRNRGDSVAVLTFNYDVGVDFGLMVNGVATDYGLADSYASDTLPLLKLHGSLNFGTCKKCGVVAWGLEPYLKAQSQGIIPKPEYGAPGKASGQICVATCPAFVI